jgi:hypothetical protein
VIAGCAAGRQRRRRPGGGGHMNRRCRRRPAEALQAGGWRYSLTAGPHQGSVLTLCCPTSSRRVTASEGLEFRTPVKNDAVAVPTRVPARPGEAEGDGMAPLWMLQRRIQLKANGRKGPALPATSKTAYTRRRNEMLGDLTWWRVCAVDPPSGARQTPAQNCADSSPASAARSGGRASRSSRTAAPSPPAAAIRGAITTGSDAGAAR